MHFFRHFRVFTIADNILLKNVKSDVDLLYYNISYLKFDTIVLTENEEKCSGKVFNIKKDFGDFKT